MLVNIYCLQIDETLIKHMADKQHNVIGRRYQSTSQGTNLFLT